ncbi:MAG: R3H domain-containing nucleic acid-binding protein [Pseudanabaenaceae cyanobacterium bins.68]|nr:R3H domain-containing nucleic acid-binding protein [Pseudanabaenaceae cyanobacterium bins.68]
MIEQAVNWLEQVLTLMALPARVTAEVDLCSERNWWLIIDHELLKPDQVQALIGEGGATLDALQHLINLHINGGSNESEPNFYTIELANYRTQRRAQLHQQAQQALTNLSRDTPEYRLEGLSASERRYVHLYLEQNHPEVATFSEGKEPNRQLVIQLRP